MLEHINSSTLCLNYIVYRMQFRNGSHSSFCKLTFNPAFLYSIDVNQSRSIVGCRAPKVNVTPIVPTGDLKRVVGTPGPGASHTFAKMWFPHQESFTPSVLHQTWVAHCHFSMLILRAILVNFFFTNIFITDTIHKILWA